MTRCTICEKPICVQCVFPLGEKFYCLACKDEALSLASLPEATGPCQEATTALRLAILSFFCGGLIIATIAIYKATLALKILSRHPRKTGHAQAILAIIIAVTGTLLWFLGIAARMAGFRGR